MMQEKVFLRLIIIGFNCSIIAAQPVIINASTEFTAMKSFGVALGASPSGEAGGEIIYRLSENFHAGVAATTGEHRTGIGVVLHGMVLQASDDAHILFTMPVLYNWMDRDSGQKNWWITLAPNISGNLRVSPDFSLCAGINLVIAVFVTAYERKENIILNDFCQLDRNVRYQIPQFGYTVVPNVGSTLRFSSTVSFSVNVWLNLRDRSTSILWTQDGSYLNAAAGFSWEL